MSVNGETAAYWRGKRVFVTGATGFVGGWLTRALVDAGAEVVALARELLPGSLFVRERLHERVVTVAGDVRDYQRIEQVLRHHAIDTCYHLAGEAIVGQAQDSPLSTFESNVQGTWHVLEAARRCPAVARVVVASSDKAYGSHARLPYTEDDALQPQYPYDVSKACADLIAQTYGRTYGRAVGVARCANIYGSGDLNTSRIIPGTMLAVLRDERPVIRSDGRFTRDYMHVADAVSAYLTLGRRLDDEEVRGQAFNFGTGAPVRVLDLVEMIIAISGKSHLTPLVMNAASGEIRDQYLSHDKARKALGWAPGWTLEAGLAEAYRWYEQFVAR